MITYRIPLRGLKFSTNKIYAGIHWTERKRIKDSILSVAGGFCRPIQKPESYPVQIRYRFFFATRPLDTLNTAAMAKMFEDAFRTLGIIEEDTPEFVARTILEVYAIDPKERSKAAALRGKKRDAKEEDWVEITISCYDRSQITIEGYSRKSIKNDLPSK